MAQSPRASIGKWKLLRTKADPTVDDTSWAAAGTDPTDALVAVLPSTWPDGTPVTRVELCFVPITSTSDLTLVNRGSGTIDYSVVQVVKRDDPNANGTDGTADAYLDSATTTISLNRITSFTIHESRRFTVRCFNDASYPGGSAALQIWWREGRA